MAPDVNEVLLTEPGSSRILEGASSNFMAVLRDGTLQTAESGILKGSVRKVVLEQCARHGVPVRLSPPDVRDVGAWAGALITSTSRLALPLDVLLLPDGQEHAFAAESLAHDVSRWVEESCEAASGRVL